MPSNPRRPWRSITDLAVARTSFCNSTLAKFSHSRSKLWHAWAYCDAVRSPPRCLRVRPEYTSA
jgi:hypothetical protein